jgi:hypothetical protein
MTIVEKDIELWEATAEIHRTQLRRCLPEKEPHYRHLAETPEAIVSLMKEYAMNADSSAFSADEVSACFT